MSTTSNDGLCRRITLANTHKELDSLLSEGETYEHASDRTRNRWKRKAVKRRAELREEALSK